MPPDVAPTPAVGPEAIDLPLKLAIARLAHGLSPASLAQAQADWLVHLMVTPSRQLALTGSAMQKAMAWSRFVLRAMQGPCEDCITPAPQDKRFSQPEWQAFPFSALAQGFLLTQAWWGEATQGVRGVSRHHEEVAAFALRQWLDMASPSNFVATNPQVLRETVTSAGMNLATGLGNWWNDAMRVVADGRPRGVEAFAPGQGVALTPGRVVMRNALIELIEYAPTTEQVDKEVVLIVPSWIMKFYILDLTPESSLVKYLVDQGHTVLMVSWRNPGAEDAHLGLDDYLHFGVLDAVKAVDYLHPGRGIHAMGYCLGGTLLSMAAALLCARGGSPLRTVSLLAAQVDFREPGELGLFVDESQIAFLEDVMAEHGYLDGRQMAGAFALINSKDLVWSKLVHEYLMGAHTPMTALRAWNADATRMPARMHSEYLRRLYLHNDLAEGRYRVHGEPVLLDEIRLPMFVLATERDHVSPWRSVYEVLRLARAPATFVLTSGGHNVGIVNPPTGPDSHPKAWFHHASHGSRQAAIDPRRWLAHAHREEGSWWPAWERWLRRHSSGHIDAAAPRPMHGGAVAAPGDYVHQR
ncbi:PHA/PHB synthase family protein [Ramlibacter rhizophilus]|uniref:Alpha/beta fold hydrolase n=1 Tax=Ramlibacter rhizophilus TaxID=1781167 RepID=A0A4Z0BI44_9BURK|nr:alpha/beta fold hydrolase [Ramlibacter rhizophilus]